MLGTLNRGLKKSATHRNVLPIGIGIAALLGASLADGQKIGFRNPTDKTTASGSITQQENEPALKPAKDLVPAPSPAPTAVVAGSDAEQDKINADRLLAERAAQEQKAAGDAKLAAQKAADDAKLAAQKAADSAKLASKKTDDDAKLAAERVTQKQAQKETRSSRDSGRRSSTVSQSANRPAPRDPPAVRRTPAVTDTNQQQPWKGTAPGG